MDCGKIRGLVALHAGGDTTGPERIAVEAHLSGCAGCAREFEGYRSGRGLLAGLREGVAPAGAIESIWTRLEPEIAPVRAVRPMKLEWALRAAAVLVIGLAVGFLVSQGGRGPSRDSLPAGSPLVNYKHSGRDSTVIGTNPGGTTAARNSAPMLGGNAPSIRFFDRVIPESGPHYLPRVEKVAASDEKSF